MDFFSTRNTVILALIQIGVVTAGVLGAGVVFKWYLEFSRLDTLPLSTRLLADDGWLLLTVPLIWSVYALRTLCREKAGELARGVAAISGVLLLVALIVFCRNAVLGELFDRIAHYDSF